MRLLRCFTFEWKLLWLIRSSRSCSRPAIGCFPLVTRLEPKQDQNEALMHARTLSKSILFTTLILLDAVAGAPAAGLREVIVVFKTHFDIGYTDMASNVVQRYRTKMIDDALKVVDQNRSLPPDEQFVSTIPG